MRYSKGISIFIHIAGWLLFYAMVIAFVSVSGPGMYTKELTFFTENYILFYIIFPAIFYCNRFLFIPFLFEKKRYLLYGLCFVALLFFIFWLSPFDRIMNDGRMQQPGPPPMEEMMFRNDDAFNPPTQQQQRDAHFDIMSIIIFLLVWLFSSGLYIFQLWRKSEQQRLQAEAEKANAELSFLKAQVNPHFLFNTLNNIYALAVSKSEHTADSIMKLSNIMRYITDEAREDKVELQQELDCMRDYIDLQRLRLGHNAQVMFTVTGSTERKKVPPLLLMTFVENTFKYGVSNHEPSPLVIRLEAGEKEIYFETMNKLYEKKTQLEREGIGQRNALQRLQHMYPSKHTIHINTTDGYYTVQLTLQS